MRFLVYLVTVLLFSTAVAQNPTVLQGNYINNVFGQANFIRNPNAYMAGANATTNPYVTTSSATVTRSTTTPLVAISEFTVTTSATNGYAEWTTRTFDQGMKYQVCEARFTYRGFSTGSTTAEVISGASTVIASQVMNPATDPQVVSILFNCGDLSQTTKLRLQQATANLSGVNEIGGIYIGLATNLSVIAQANKVGGFDNVSCSAEAQVTTGTSFTAPTTTGTCQGTAVGLASASLSNLNNLQMTFTSLPPGEYLLLMPAYVYTSAVAYARCDGRIRETTLNYVDGQNAFSSYQAAFTNFGSIGQINQFKFTNTVTANRTFQIEFARQSGNANCLGGFISQSGGANRYQNVSLTRFPTTSEQVLTPNITSTWGGVKWAGNVDFVRTTLASDFVINTTNFAGVTTFGKANIASTTCGLATNDIGMCLQNVPPGTYEITSNIELGSVFSLGSAGVSFCSAHIDVAGTSLASTRGSSAFAVAYVSNAEDWTMVGTGIVRIDSFQTNLSVALKITKSTNLGACIVRSQAAAAGAAALPTITLKPIDYQLPLPVFIDQTPYTVTATSLTAPVAPYGRFEASGASTTITLFGCNAATKGYNVEVKRVDASNNITVARSGSDTIDGATSDLLAVNFQATQYVCNGSGGWRRF